MTFLDDIQNDLLAAGIPNAIATKKTSEIFDWLMASFSYQGISDRVAAGYMARNGNASWKMIVESLERDQPCPRLKNYWTFDACRYDKGSFTCSDPDHIASCAVPLPRLRNGRLNQTAFSFFLFTRDVAKGDIVEWIDGILRKSANAEIETAIKSANELVDALRNIYGVSDKILSMSLSALLIGARVSHPHWFNVGASMIAIDTLVHNFLHRTGILEECGTSHSYGPGCYAPNGCADILYSAASSIDARRFNASFPAVFPRFVQHAVWRYCAADGLAICNGHRIDDQKPCKISFCHLFADCRKTALKPQLFHVFMPFFSA